MTAPGCTCLPYPYGTGPEEDCPVHGREERPAPTPATEADCKLVGAGDGSVLVYCTPCRRCLHPNAVTLNAVLGLWEEHAADAHEVPSPGEFASTVSPDPWTDPDAAAAAEPPPF